MKRSYIIDVDGEFFTVKNGKEASDLLDRVVEMYGDVDIEIVKPPKIKVKTGSNRPTKSKKILEKVEEAQTKVREIYERRIADISKQRDIDKEISSLMSGKLAQEQDDQAIITLLLH